MNPNTINYINSHEYTVTNVPCWYYNLDIIRLNVCFDCMPCTEVGQ